MMSKIRASDGSSLCAFQRRLWGAAHCPLEAGSGKKGVVETGGPVECREFPSILQKMAVASAWGRACGRFERQFGGFGMIHAGLPCAAQVCDGLWNGCQI